MCGNPQQQGKHLPLRRRPPEGLRCVCEPMNCPDLARFGLQKSRFWPQNLPNRASIHRPAGTLALQGCACAQGARQAGAPTGNRLQKTRTPLHNSITCQLCQLWLNVSAYEVVLQRSLTLPVQNAHQAPDIMKQPKLVPVTDRRTADGVWGCSLGETEAIRCPCFLSQVAGNGSRSAACRPPEATSRLKMHETGARRCR